MGIERLGGLPTIVERRFHDLFERRRPISRRMFGSLVGVAAVGTLLAGNRVFESFDTPDPTVEQITRDLRLFRDTLQSVLKTSNDPNFWTAIDVLGSNNLLSRNLTVIRGDTSSGPLAAVTDKFGSILPPINYYLGSPYDDPNLAISEETIPPEQRRNDLALKVYQGLAGEIIGVAGTFSINQAGRFGSWPTRYGDNTQQLIDLAGKFFIDPPRQWVDTSNPLGKAIKGTQHELDKALVIAMQPRGIVSFTEVYKR